MQDQLAANNFLALNKKSFAVKFDLDDTDYYSVENIGTGAYGVVCMAVHRRSNERVAIKKIPNIFKQLTIAMRTYREIRILRHFQHSNIISIREILKPREGFDTFQDVYIVLDLMESDLHRIIYSPQDLTNEHIRWFVYQILRGLKYIHSANVVHRDLKPSNLLVNGNCDLKIGDFGMARGIYSIPDDADIKMTQYVATRWYRAPEIMLLSPTYTTGVDIWSVGCIMAEMIMRRPLFPGKDFRNQLQMIFDVVGTPSESYVEVAHSDLIKEYLTKLSPRKSVDFTELFPGAAAKAIRLLQRFLNLDPKDRLTVNEALRDPYLSVHHEPDDEPFCIPPFDFSFEQRFKDMLDKKELQSDLLRIVISKEIRDYHAEKTELVDSVGLNLQLDSCLPISKDPTLEIDRSKESSQSSNVGKVIASKQTAFIKDNVNVIEESLKIEISEADDKPAELLTVDTETVFPKCSALLAVNGHDDIDNDVRMLSAKLEEQCSISTIDHSSVVPGDCGDAMTSENQNALLDMKAKIKAALLSKPRAEIFQREKITFKQRKAIKVQKEREEERRRKQEKALLRKMKKKINQELSSASGPVLTAEDRNLLERWQSMQKSSLNQTAHHQNSKTSSLLPSNTFEKISLYDGIISPQAPFAGLVSDAVYLRQLNSTVSTLSAQFSAVERTVPSTPLLQPSIIPSFTRQIDGNGVSAMASATGFETSCGRSLQPQHLVPSYSLRQNIPITESSVYWMSSDNQLQTQPAADTSRPMSIQNFLPSYREAVAAKQFNVQRQTDSIGQMMSLVGTPPQRPLPSLGKYTLDRQESQAFTLMGLESVGISDVLDMDRQSGSDERRFGILPPSESRFADGQTSTSRSNNPLISGFTRAEGGIPEVERAAKDGSALSGLFQRTFVTPGFDQLHVASNRMMKSQAEDLTLLHTPRGTGFGYGVGMDINSYMMTSNLPDNSTGVGEGLESAPVSATLMADWREVTGDMDANDFEAAMQEMGSYININDFNALN